MVFLDFYIKKWYHYYNGIFCETEFLHKGEVDLKKRIFSLLIAIASIFTFCINASAFDANDYDYSFDSDWGSSDWGSSDWDSDNDYYFPGSTSSGSSSGGGGIGLGTAIVIIVVIIIIVSSKKNGNNPGGGGTTGMGGGVRPANGGQGLNVNLPDRTSQIEQIIKQDDPNFTADDFTAFAKNVYIDIQNAWCKRDLTPVRPVMHTNLYNTTQKQVQSKIEQKVVYHYESIAINTAYLTSFVRDEQYEYLTVYLNARFIDYQTNEESGAIIRGDKNTRWDFRYKMKFMRSVGMKTNDANASEYETGHNCPNCGAPLEMSSSGQCAYCGSVVSTGQYSWVLSDFTTIRNDTKDDGIRVANAQNQGEITVLLLEYNPEIKQTLIAEISKNRRCSIQKAHHDIERLPCIFSIESNSETVKFRREFQKNGLANFYSPTEGIFDIVLTNYPEEMKVAVIDVIRKSCGYELAEAKKLAENLPSTVDTVYSKKLAQEIANNFIALGANVEIK